MKVLLVGDQLCLRELADFGADEELAGVTLGQLMEELRRRSPAPAETPDPQLSMFKEDR